MFSVICHIKKSTKSLLENPPKQNVKPILQKLKNQAMKYFAIFTLLFFVSTTFAQNTGLPLSNQNAAFYIPALGYQSGFVVNSQLNLGSESSALFGAQYQHSVTGWGISANTSVFWQKNIMALTRNKLSVSKLLRFKDFSMVLAAGIDNNNVGPSLETYSINTGISLRYKKLQLAVSHTPQYDFVDGHEPVFVGTTYPSEVSLLSSYQFSIGDWSFEPMVFYRRLGNFTSTQFQSTSIYKGRFIAGVNYTYSDPHKNQAGAVFGYRTKHFDFRGRYQIETQSPKDYTFQIGISYLFKGTENMSSIY